MVVGDVDVGISNEVGLSAQGVPDLDVEVQFLDEGGGPVVVQLEKVEVGMALPIHEVVAETSYFVQHAKVPLRLHLQEGVLHLQCHFLPACQDRPVHLGQ